MHENIHGYRKVLYIRYDMHSETCWNDEKKSLLRGKIGRIKLSVLFRAVYMTEAHKMEQLRYGKYHFVSPNTRSQYSWATVLNYRYNNVYYSQTVQHSQNLCKNIFLDTVKLGSSS